MEDAARRLLEGYKGSQRGVLDRSAWKLLSGNPDRVSVRQQA